MTTDLTTEIDYPTGDGKPMAETHVHLVAMILLTQALQDFFRARPDVFVFADQFWYWEKGNRKAVIAPDILVITGTRPRDIRERGAFFAWEEPKAVPAVVFEMASKSTWREDLGKKYERFQELGVREYFIFDPEAIYLDPQLQGFRLRAGKFRPLLGKPMVSQLGFEMRVEGMRLRLIDKRTGGPIPTREESIEAEKKRAEALQAEVERLKALLQKHGHANGSGA